jgi:hypothetical protein
MSQTLYAGASRPPDSLPTSSRPLIGAVSACSVAQLAVGAWLLAHPALNPLLDPGGTLARAVLGVTAATLLLLALGVVGLLTGTVALARPRVTRRILVAVAAVELVGALLLETVSSIALAGYLVAMALPLGLVWVAVQVIRRYRRLRWVTVVALLVAGGWGVWTGTLWPSHLAGLATNLGAGFVGNATHLVLAALVTSVAVCWALIMRDALRSTPSTSSVAGWVLRHRRGLTVLAAAGPLPYAAIRASWLTSWPLLKPSDAALDPEIRLWGLLLGGGALLGAVLTVGLIRPWGVVFPRWMPRWAGRPVPVRAATVPGGLVAAVLCLTALPMVRGTLWPEAGSTVFVDLGLLERLGATLIFPFWIWGPALALAVWGYALSRRPGVSPR